MLLFANVACFFLIAIAISIGILPPIHTVDLNGAAFWVAGAAAYLVMTPLMLISPYRFADAFEQTAAALQKQLAAVKGANTALRAEMAQRDRAERALKDSEARFRALAEMMPEVTCETDLQGRMTFLSRAGLEKFGYDDHDVNSGLSVAELVAPDDRLRATDLLARSLSGFDAGLTEYLGQRKHGGTFPILVRARPLVQGDATAGLRILIVDISERKRLEEQIRRSEKLHALGTLAGGVAHDFNNLLTVIQGYTSLLRHDIAALPPAQEKLEAIATCTDSAAHLVRQLLGVARAGPAEMRPRAINDVVKQALELFGRTHKELKLEMTLGEALPSVVVDHHQIQQVILNLLVNAAHVTPQGGTVRVTTQLNQVEGYVNTTQGLLPGSYVVVTVLDHGIGMDDETRRHIFEPFFTTKARGRGTGLGLASAYGLVKSHGGSIDFDTTLGKGSSFRVWLPSSEAPPLPIVSSVAQASAPSGHETLLVVDDEKFVADITALLLSNAGYTVRVAYSGEDAVTLLAREGPSIALVILDLVMPDMSGAETFDRLRALQPGLRVLVLSGYGFNDEAAAIMARGGSGVLQKPYALNDLGARIRTILDAAPGQEQKSS